VQHAKLVAVSTKDNFRRAVPKAYSYRYEIAGDAGPDGEPLVRAGSVIIESRYRGRSANWTIARSPVSSETYTVRGGYVHPLPENTMAYPPRSTPLPEAVAPPAPAPAPVADVVHLPTSRFDSQSAPRRSGARPTPANESAYREKPAPPGFSHARNADMLKAVAAHE
jgi:hypothetical protein